MTDGMLRFFSDIIHVLVINNQLIKLRFRNYGKLKELGYIDDLP